MSNCYQIPNVKKEEFKSLKSIEKSLVKAAKEDFNEYSIKFWGKRVREIRAELEYVHDSRKIFFKFEHEGIMEPYNAGNHFPEAYNQLAFNMRYQVKKALKEIRRK